MIDREIDLFNKIIYCQNDQRLFKIENQQNTHWYMVKSLVKGKAREYLERQDILENFEILQSETSIDEWEIVLKNLGYEDYQIQFLKDCDDPETVMSFMPAIDNFNKKKLIDDDGWDN